MKIPKKNFFFFLGGGGVGWGGEGPGWMERRMKFL